jgi:hypothetical protein
MRVVPSLPSPRVLSCLVAEGHTCVASVSIEDRIRSNRVDMLTADMLARVGAATPTSRSKEKNDVWLNGT